LNSVNDDSVDYIYRTNQANFSKIPGMPIAYWVSKNIITDFKKGINLEKLCELRQGVISGNTNEFMRFWTEVSVEKEGFNCSKFSDIKKYHKKWFPYNKGGSFRRWTGNLEYVINMENEGYDIVNSGKNNNYRLRDPKYYFQEVLTWSKISSGKFSARYLPQGTIFDIAGCCIFGLGSDNYYILSLLNSKPISSMLKMISPTINFEVDHIKKLPILEATDNTKFKIDKLGSNNINISKKDWDSFETSWDFNHHPLLLHIADDKKLSAYKCPVKSNKSANIVPKLFQIVNNGGHFNG